MNEFLRTLPSNVFHSFTGRRSLFHVLAIFLTALLVSSHFDWWYFSHMRESGLAPYLWPAIALGGIIPIVAPIFGLIGGFVLRSAALVRTGYALAQSALLGLLISSSYKAFTGRVPPMRHMVAPALDNSQEFQFGFMRGGVFWGWPSSHTTVAFATMVTLAILYAHRPKIKYPALLYALYVGVGVTVGIHWFSEFVAGSLIGTAIGIVVGRSFTDSKDNTTTS
jgi:membrane-associated phospholipid phosphatase